MAKRNPFARALKGESSSADQGASAKASAVEDRVRLPGVKSGDSAGEQQTGRKEVPTDGAENAETAAGAAAAEFGLSSVNLADARADIGVVGDVADGEKEDTDTTVETAEERVGRRAGDAGALSPEDLSGSEDDHVPSQVDDIAGDPRQAVASMLPDRNPLNDPLVAAGMGIVAETANSRATSPLSAASGGSNPLADAINSVTPEDAARAAEKAGVTPSSAPPAEPGKDDDANKSSNVDVVSKGSAGVVNNDAMYWDTEKGEVVPAEQVTKSGKVAAEADMTTTREYNKSAEAEGKSGTSIFSAIGEFFADRAYEAEWGETEKQAAAAQAKRAGGGASQYDPENEGGPPSEAEVAFRQALRNAAGIRRVSGDVDPVEGDGSQATGSVDAATEAAIMESTSNESLVGNPGDVDSARVGGRPVGTSPGGPGGSGPGTDVDPLEGSAFTGGTRGGDPRELDLGVGGAPLADIRDNDDEDDDEDDDEEGEDS